MILKIQQEIFVVNKKIDNYDIEYILSDNFDITKFLENKIVKCEITGFSVNESTIIIETDKGINLTHSNYYAKLTYVYPNNEILQMAIYDKVIQSSCNVQLMIDQTMFECERSYLDYDKAFNELGKYYKLTFSKLFERFYKF
jgi:hypothetical protein